jgi:hypothetical protein
MTDSESRFIGAAVRSLSGNAEQQAAAARFLENDLDGNGGGHEQATRRWDELDAKRGRPVWHIALFVVLLVASVMVLIPGISEFKKLRVFSSMIAAMGGSAVSHEEEPVMPGKKSLTNDERLILYGDESQSSKAGREKGIWDRFPENPAYFAQYAEAYLSQTAR